MAMNTFERPIIYLLAAAALGYAGWLLMTRRQPPDPARKKGWRLRFALATLASVALLAGLFWKPVQPETFRKHSAWLEGKGPEEPEELKGAERVIYELRVIGRLQRLINRLRHGQWVSDPERPLIPHVNGVIYPRGMEPPPIVITCYAPLPLRRPPPAFAQSAFAQWPYERQLAIKAIWMSLDPTKTDRLRKELDLLRAGGYEIQDVLMLKAYLELSRSVSVPTIQNSSFEQTIVALSQEARRQFERLAKTSLAPDVRGKAEEKFYRLCKMLEHRAMAQEPQSQIFLADGLQQHAKDHRRFWAVFGGLHTQIEAAQGAFAHARKPLELRAHFGADAKDLDLWLEQREKDPSLWRGFDRVWYEPIHALTGVVFHLAVLPPMPNASEIPWCQFKLRTCNDELFHPTESRTVLACIGSDGQLIALDGTLLNTRYTWIFEAPPRPMWVKLKIKNGKPVP